MEKLSERQRLLIGLLKGLEVSTDRIIAITMTVTSDEQIDKLLDYISENINRDIPEDDPIQLNVGYNELFAEAVRIMKTE